MLDFSQEGMLKFKNKAQSLIIKRAYRRILDWKSKRWDHAIKFYLHVQKINLKKKKVKSQISGEFL